MLLRHLDLPERSPLRAAIDAATRCPEPECVAALIPAADLDDAQRAAARALALELAAQLRASRSRAGGVDALMREFSLSSDEGVALMCLAEALLRIPDAATADALIRDKIANGNWGAHIGASPSLFVNAAAWGLLITGKLVATHSEQGLGAALARLAARGGEPLIRAGVDLALRLLGRQFVTGETIAAALERARECEARGYRYSYDMLGEAALTSADAGKYWAAYEAAIDAIGAAGGGRGVIEGPGISVKLSALHPRYALSQRDRVLSELLPRLHALCVQAKRHDIGLNVDAEESERLGLSLDLLEALARSPQLAGWDGLGFVVQAYQKRGAFVIDWLAELARATRRRLMVRLVKGAYWDSEIKRAQVEGQCDYPVFTRKLHTDVSYLACARKLLAASDHIFPQFATHNALTLATVLQMARAAGAGGAVQWEFQCLHGMGEPLYDRVVGPEHLNRPCRIYAPVGSHETLLPYLVRRLLENGANSSFVNRIVDPKVGLDELVRDPVQAARATGGAPHPNIALPAQLYAAAANHGESAGKRRGKPESNDGKQDRDPIHPPRRNSSGLDLNDERTLRALDEAFERAAAQSWQAAPLLAAARTGAAARAVLNPATGEPIGQVIEAGAADVEAALAAAAAGADAWAATPAAQRAAALERAADAFEAQRAALMFLAVREAGKTVANALAEVREAIDFLRYYAAQARVLDASARPGRALGPVACISPWNFPLAIFTGQAAAALAAGNVVLAKPAEQTPLTAALATRLLLQAGVPAAALQLLPGDGAVGARLTADARIKGVVFTGSTEVARLIDRALAQRAGGHEPHAAATGRSSAAEIDIPLIAETGGQNAMIVDSSALPEQVVADVLASAFDSAGQRCSALRVLCLQEDVADRILAMLRGAFAEQRVGDPADLRTDVGPVIDAEARDRVEAYLTGAAPQRLAALGAGKGTFVAPAIVEAHDAAAIDRLTCEVFGPVLHVVRWRRDELAALVARINGLAYGLTLGIHSRIDETIDFIAAHARVGNIYVNRNMIGAVVGVQPFGGEGLSGTGPKAGGPWYLPRLRHGAAPPVVRISTANAPALNELRRWAQRTRRKALSALCDRYASAIAPPAVAELPGPTGERNCLSWHPRGRVLCLARDEAALAAQIAAVLATGNRAVIAGTGGGSGTGAAALVAALPAAVAARITRVDDWRAAPCELVLHAAENPSVVEVRRALAEREGARVRVVQPAADDPASYPLHALLVERVISVNTAAAGGNASLMTLGPA